MPDHDPNLLESWKDIAAFLGRDKRTAMRWAENHTMPVHRFPGHKQARVFAYRHELAAWLETFKDAEPIRVPRHDSTPVAAAAANSVQVQEEMAVALQEAAVSANVDKEFPDVPNGSKALQTVPEQSLIPSGLFGERWNGFLSLLWLKRRLFGAAIGIFAIVVVLLAILQPSARLAAVARAAGLLQLTDDGRTKENLRTDGTNLFFDELVGVNRTLAAAPIEGGPVRPIPSPFNDVSIMDVSRNGKSLLVASDKGVDSLGQLWQLPAQGGTPTRVGQVHCSAARWSPDGARIAFSAGNGLYITDTEGHEPHLIGAFDTTPSNLIWSPDGRWLRFVVENVKSHGLIPWEIDTPGTKTILDGNAAAELHFHSSCCTNWTWFGDNRDFAYVVQPDDGGAHFNLTDQRLILSGRWGTQREFTSDFGRIDSLASGKRGSRLYFLVSNTARGELLRFNAREAAFNSYLPGLSAQYLSFSRDGKWMTYALTQDDSLWRSRSDGTQALQIIAPPMAVQLSSWSPDGTQIAFMGRKPGAPWRVYLVGRDGGEPREASSGEDNQGAPTWSPDGKTLVYGRIYCKTQGSCGIFLLDLETGWTRPLPESAKLHTARWSPDGRYIAALERDTQAVQLFDWKKRRWRRIAEGTAGNDLNWSKDSKILYVSCVLHANPSIDKVRVSDRSRSTAVDLAPLKRMSGKLEMWFGLSPDDSPIFVHLNTSSEVYALDPNEE